MHMAPQDGHDAGAPNQANSRVRRRDRKRQGPPQLQFVTATDPSQFKDETAKRSVRSQAMIQYRYNKAEQQKQKDRSSGSPEGGSRFGTPVPERIAPSTSNGAFVTPPANPLMVRVLDEQQEQHHLYPSTSAAWWGTNPHDSLVDPALLDQPTPTPSCSFETLRYQHAYSVVPHQSTAKAVTAHNYSDEQEESLMRMLCAKLASVSQIGDGVDPFSVIPQFTNPEINSLYLVRKCNRAFVSPSTMVKWLPTMLAHPHILLSSTVLASTWLDMHAGCSGDSKRTAMVKGEVIGWINERLLNPATQYDDLTLMVILHLLAGEMWSCNEKTMHIHESGIARLIVERGGMHCLGANGVLAQVAASCSFHLNIFCESLAPDIFRSYEPPSLGPIDSAVPLPESPVFCPRGEFPTIIHSDRCSPHTYELLCDMRDLTDIFIAFHSPQHTEHGVESGHSAGHQALSPREYDAKVAEIRSHLAALPSAYTPGLLVTGDWVYESCRIASIIYASAITLRVPLSEAAQPGRSPILNETACLSNAEAGDKFTSVRLTEALYETLERSNLNDIWGTMSGVLYWVIAVGAAAARTPTSINMSAPRSRNEAYATWVRRCLIMFMTRNMIVLVFEHPLSVLMAQKRLLRVQELLSSASTERFTT